MIRSQSCTAILISILISTAAWSEECPNVRLDQSSLSHVPIANQDGNGLCFAYAAAALIDAWRFSHGDKNTKFLTSPIALTANLPDWAESLAGHGYIDEVLDNTKYICNSRPISRHFRDSDFDVYEVPDMSRLRKPDRGVSCEVTSPELTPLPPSALGSITKTIGKDIFDKSVVGVIGKVCKGSDRMPLTIPTSKTVLLKNFEPSERGRALGNKMKDLLRAKNPQPVAVNICKSIYWEKSFEGIDEKGGLGKCKLLHFSVVVGSRKGASGKCEFLVRDSSGPSCGSRTKYEWPCERGQLWIDGDSLAKNVSGLTWLEY